MTLPDSMGYTPRYKALWTQATPGLVIFLIDQSASMSQHGAYWIPIAERVAHLVNSAIWELCNMSTFVNWDDEEYVANTMFVKCIGYGFDYDESSYDIVDGWISDYKEKKYIIQPRAYGLPNMTEAFAKVADIIQAWKQRCLELDNRNHDPVPLIFHLTKGTNIGNDEELVKNAQLIKSIEMRDGHPLLFNLLFPTHGFYGIWEFPSEELFASYKLAEEYEMIIKTASAFPQEMIEEYQQYGYKYIPKDSLCIMLNPTRIPIEHIRENFLIW